MWTFVLETYFLRQEDVEDSTLSTVTTGTTDERKHHGRHLERAETTGKLFLAKV